MSNIFFIVPASVYIYSKSFFKSVGHRVNCKSYEFLKSYERNIMLFDLDILQQTHACTDKETSIIERKMKSV